VKQFGPLWTHGCWVFEHMVGVLKNQTHARKTRIHLSIGKLYDRLTNHLLYSSALSIPSTSGTNITIIARLNILLGAAHIFSKLGLRSIVDHPEHMKYL